MQEMFFNALTMIGGLALFLYGMHVMGEGLTAVSGGRLEKILEKMTNNPIKGVLLGAGVTAVIQSSSATTVTVVGFVNSGIMKLEQAVGVIMGANIGTTITSWLLSLTGIEGGNFFMTLAKPTSFTPILAVIGIIMIMTAKTEKRKDIGTILVGFAVLMFGMDTMSEAVKPLADVPAFQNLMVKFSNPFLGLIVGAVLTAIIQSSSASVGILQAFCATGALGFSTALPIIMGQNIGTCITALLSSVGASKNAKRTALVHLYFNVLGTFIFMALFYSLNGIFRFPFMAAPASEAGIAIIHTAFNVTATLVLLPFGSKIAKLAKLSVRDDQTEDVEDVFAKLDVRFLETPALALEQCKRLVNEMAFLALENMTEAISSIGKFKPEMMEKVEKTEEKVDRYEEALTDYLRKLGGRTLLEEDADQVNMLLYCVRDFERISDHACNIAEEAAKMAKNDISWPKKTEAEISEYAAEVHNIVSTTVSSFIKEDMEVARTIEALEDNIDKINKKIKKQNMKRIKKEKCTPEAGIIVTELATNFERVSDHCENIAISFLGESVSEMGES